MGKFDGLIKAGTKGLELVEEHGGKVQTVLNIGQTAQGMVQSHSAVKAQGEQQALQLLQQRVEQIATMPGGKIEEQVEQVRAAYKSTGIDIDAAGAEKTITHIQKQQKETAHRA